MALSTALLSGLVEDRTPHAARPALVLMGGGARTAYQVGVLRAIARQLRARAHQLPHGDLFPFKVLVGTSAGALNAAFLAGQAADGMAGFERLASFWASLRSSQVYRIVVPPWARSNKWLTAFALARAARERGALLDNTPLIQTLEHAVSMPGIERSLTSGALRALAVTASSYTTGVHWTFCHTSADSPKKVWERPERRAIFLPIAVEHLMASSAIPFIFPARPIDIGGRVEYFGDGSMRHLSPLSAPLHLGARRVLVVGVGQPQRAGFAGLASDTARAPTLGAIAGHAMASVFHDTLQADVEQTTRVTRTMLELPREVAAHMPYKPISVLSIQPTQSLDALAQQHSHELPAITRKALGDAGGLAGSGAAMASYLLFEPGFVNALIALGGHDAQAREADIAAFFDDSRVAVQ
jgi:NTE family protein